MKFFRFTVPKKKYSAAVLMPYLVGVLVLRIYDEWPVDNDTMARLYIVAGMIVLDLVRILWQ